MMSSRMALLALMLSYSPYLYPTTAFIRQCSSSVRGCSSFLCEPTATRLVLNLKSRHKHTNTSQPGTTALPPLYAHATGSYTSRGRQGLRQQEARLRGRPRQPSSSSTIAASAIAAGVDCSTEDMTSFEPERSTGRVLAPHDAQVRRFEEWAATVTSNTHGGCHDEAREDVAKSDRGSNKARLLHADFDGLRGLMTEGPVRPWQTIATLPMSAALQEFLVPDTSKFPPPEPLSIDAWERCPWWVRLGVRLLKEKALGERSGLRDYVGLLLPKQDTGKGMGTPSNWSTEQLERLYYPRLLSLVAVQRRLFDGFRRFLLADATHPGISNEHNEDTTEDGGALLMKELADPLAFSWALECVLSRAFQLPSINTRRPSFEDVDDNHDVPARAPELEAPAPGDARMALLPLIDSMNHYSRIPTTMYWEEDGESLSVAVGVNLDPGDHAFLSYGPISNDDLLQYYGFVERDNPSDTYVLNGMGESLRQDGLLTADLTARLLACPAARETWRYLRKGVLLRDAVHPTTMQAVRVICCERRNDEERNDAANDAKSPGAWDGTEADLARFASPVSLASEIEAMESIMRYSAQEADTWGSVGGVACALAEEPTATGLDGDLDGLGLDDDRRLMLSVFRQEKIKLLRGVVSRLTHMRKVSDLLQKPIKMPVDKSPPPVLGTSLRC